MFILHSSNKTENLLEHLATIIGAAPLSSPFEKEVFLIQSQGMERWLSQQLALKFDVFANFDFLFPTAFFNQMARKIHQKLNTDVFAREFMVWRFELLLRGLNNPVFLPLQHYLAGENNDLKRFQLASHLTQIFDQYQIMRPDLLNKWQAGKLHYHNQTEKWQQALWKQLIEQTDEQHRGALWLQTIEKFNQQQEGSLSTQLPERISVFGLNTMPPLFMAFLQGLARHTEVHFYLLNPAQAFWADMVSKKQADLDEFENGHPLLASLGQQGREFQQMLLDHEFTMELNSFEENTAPQLSNLQQLQNDILNNLTEADSLINDSSLSIHSCHSRLREVEVLKDQLLHALETDSELELRDIIVMAPDIQHYIPFISAVFDNIQHGIADRSLRRSNATLDAYIRFLRLSQGRFGWQSVMDLLSQKEVYQCFGLTETDVELIAHWVAETRIRWGKSATHKKELNLPEAPENTWQAGLDRLLMGYAVGHEDKFYAGILPYSQIEGHSALALGGLYDFIQLLFRASKELSKTYSLQEWSKKLLYYVDLLFPAAPMDTAQQVEKQQINSTLLELSEALTEVHQQPVSLAVILAWLEGRVDETKSANGFLRGQLTFCSMLPMRSIPFKVIALLGMNEGEFPHIDHHLTFDLLGKDFKPGDRSRRADDRYQFLEILLSARQQIIMSYIGQSINENEEIPASVVIQELLDIMRTHYQLNDLVIKHPLQSFSSRYFTKDTPLFSYSQTDLSTARALTEKANNAELWWQGQLHPPELADEVIHTNDLFSFYRHPQKYFLQTGLAIQLQYVSAENPEREPFSLEDMESYLIEQQWVEAKLNQENLSLPKLKAQGRWISGELGEVVFTEKEQDINRFVEKIQAKQAGSVQDSMALDLTVGSVRLTGSLSNMYTHGSLFYRYAAMKGKDFMQAWLHHLLINRIRPQTTHLISLDYFIRFSPEHIRGDELEQLLTYFQLGQQHPDAFFTEAAFAFIKQQHKLKHSTRSSKPALVVAQESLTKAIEQSYEPELNLLYKNLERVDTLLNADFEAYCQQLLLPAWEAANAQ